MTFGKHLAALALTGAVLCLPNAGAAQVMIGTFLSALVTQTATSGAIPVEEPQAVAFDWRSNGANAPSASKTKAALAKYRVINGSGSWICSPVGFGKRSVCYAG